MYAKLLRATQFAASSKSLRIGYRPIRHDPRIRLAAAFEPDVGESVADLSDKMPAAAKSVGPVGDGFLAVDPDAFAANFAADPPKPVARFMSPVARPDLAASFPLILTCAKPSLFCQTQHRALPGLRKRALDPEIELNPATASARGIRNGDWVDVRTPAGGMRARARFSAELDPRVVVGEHAPHRHRALQHVKR